MRSSPATALKNSPKIIQILMVGVTLGVSMNALGRTEKTSEQYWRETDMKLEYLLSDYFVSNSNCNSDFKKFQACTDALNAIGARAKPALEVLPESVLQDPAVKAGPERLKLPSGFVVTESAGKSTEKLPLKVIQEKRLAREAAIKKGEQGLYEVASTKGPVDFVGDVGAMIAQAAVKPEDVPAAAAGAISAYVAGAVDSHSRLEPVAEMNDESNDANNEFFGIGAVLRLIDEAVVIQQVMENSPASKYGVEANDMIVQVNGAPIEKLELAEVVKMIRGPENTKVVLAVVRKGESKKLEVVRGRVEVKNVKVSVMDLLGAKYLVVKLSSFVDKNACNSIQAQVAEQSAKNPSIQGLIMDVRDNGGGLLQQAVCIGSLFVGEKTIVKVKDLNQGSFTDYAGTRGAITRLPMVTLINSNSASASEILAGAVQDYQRSWIVGERSFGKGSVQAPTLLTPKIYMFKTISRFYQPTGRTNQIVGILPDFDVPVKPDATEEERFRLREADVFPNALDAVGEAWVQPRQCAVARVQKCLTEKAASTAAYKAGELDYQLLSGAEVLQCDASAPPVPKDCLEDSVAADPKGDPKGKSL